MKILALLALMPLMANPHPFVAPQEPSGKEVVKSEQKPSTESVEMLTLQFGVYRTDKASTVYRSFLPIIIGIQDGMEERLKRPVEIEIQIFKTYQEGLDALVNGDVDFVRFGPASYVLAKERDKEIELLAMEHKKGKKIFKGVIAVRAESPIKNLSDLKGKSFAFGDENSTIGRYLAQAELIKVGIHGKDLGRTEFLGRHDIVAKAVEMGDFDAGSLKISTFEKMNAKGKLRILWSFDNVTKPWIAKSGLDTRVLQALKEVMLTWDDSEALQALKISGWLICKDSEYQKIRQSMALAKKEF